MATNFVRTSVQYLNSDAPSVTDQITISAFVRQATTQSGGFPNGYFILSRQNAGNSTSEINYAMHIRNGLNFEWTISSNNYRSINMSLTNDTNFHHYCTAVNWSNGTYSFSKDGSVTTGTFVSSTPSTNANFVSYIGRQGNSSSPEAMNGDIAEVAIWNTKISDSEIKSLGKGFLPLSVRPQSLVRYWPLVRNLSEIRNGTAVTNNNTTPSPHPAVYA